MTRRGLFAALIGAPVAAKAVDPTFTASEPVFLYQVPSGWTPDIVSSVEPSGYSVEFRDGVCYLTSTGNWARGELTLSLDV